MRRFFVRDCPGPNSPIELDRLEALHAVRVLRLGDGETVLAIDGQGRAVTAKLRLEGPKGSAKGVFLDFVAEGPSKAVRETAPIVLEMALVKNDAMAWIVEKAVELGVETLVPVITERCVLKFDERGPDPYLQRWARIGEQSLKQCGRHKRLEITRPKKISELVKSTLSPNALRLWADESIDFSDRPEKILSSTTLGKNLPEAIHLLVGPEGGFSEEEREWIQAAARPVGKLGKTIGISLGPLVLRAETAAVYMISVVQNLFFSGQQKPASLD